jgi:hypothetical protein
MEMNYTSPYGLNPPPSPVASVTETLYQGDRLELRRRLIDPITQEPCSVEHCFLEFTVVDRRFETEQLFKADWTKGITMNPDGVVSIIMPTEATSKLRRGSYLYSITWWSRLKDSRKVLEEGTLLVEYSADAQDPEVPYNAGDVTREEQTSNAG